MQLQITSKNSDIEYFIKDYLLPEMRDLFIAEVNLKKLKKFDKLLGVSSYNVLLYYMTHLSVSHIGDDKYIIKSNDYTVVKNKPIVYYINYITYGNLNIQGYKILINIFKYIKENINDIYEDYLSEC